MLSSLFLFYPMCQISSDKANVKCQRDEILTLNVP